MQLYRRIVLKTKAKLRNYVAFWLQLLLLFLQFATDAMLCVMI